MPNPTSSSKPSPPARDYAPLAGFLSYLVPGLGQIYQGRVGKGVLFLVCIYALFFYGMYLGRGKVHAVEIDGQKYDEFTVNSNVYLPDASKLPEVNIRFLRLGGGYLIDLDLGGAAKALSYRPQFLGQFWVGIAAWPAMGQYLSFDGKAEGSGLLGNFQRTPPEQALNKLQVEEDANGDKGGKKFDLGWVYTVIAGVLNIMVIYDAFAGPAYAAASAASTEVGAKHADPVAASP